MKILVISSKYFPEYSGSGHRAHATFKRLRSKFNLDFDVVSSSLEKSGVKKFIYEKTDVTRISGLIPAAKFKGVAQKIILWVNFPFEIISSSL